MALFGFFKPMKPVQFTYHPRFYDEKREEMLERRKEAEALQGDSPEALKARIRRSMRRQSTYLIDKKFRQQKVAKSNMMLLAIIAVLCVLVFVAIEVYLPRFMHYFE
ncbi:MAG: hypothetical protein GC192_04515 [Bacteroidetes bacterium]|nr:hypothetical protein [Bacteroidota bacterium]